MEGNDYDRYDDLLVDAVAAANDEAWDRLRSMLAELKIVSRQELSVSENQVESGDTEPPLLRPSNTLEPT